MDDNVYLKGYPVPEMYKCMIEDISLLGYRHYKVTLKKGIVILKMLHIII